MMFNLLMMLVGLFVSFLGPKFHKLSAAIEGFILGFVAHSIVARLYLQINNGFQVFLNYGDLSSFMFIIVFFAILVAFLSVLFDRLAITLNVYFSGFTLAFMILHSFATNLNEVNAIVVVCLIIALIPAVILYHYKNFFAIQTAYTGAFIYFSAFLCLLQNYNFIDFLTEFAFMSDMINIICFLLGIYFYGSVGYSLQKYDDIAVDLKNMISNIKSRVLKGRRIADIVKCDTLLLASVCFYIVYPCLCNLLGMVVDLGIIYSELTCIYMIADAVFVGLLTYIIRKKGLIQNILYLLPYIIGFVYFTNISDFYGIHLTRIYLSSVIVTLFRLSITWGIVFIANKVVKEERYKPILLVVIAYVSYYFVLDCVIKTGIRTFFSNNTLIGLIVCIVASIIMINRSKGLDKFKDTFKQLINQFFKEQQ